MFKKYIYVYVYIYMLVFFYVQKGMAVTIRNRDRKRRTPFSVLVAQWVPRSLAPAVPPSRWPQILLSITPVATTNRLMNSGLLPMTTWFFWRGETWTLGTTRGTMSHLMTSLMARMTWLREWEAMDILSGTTFAFLIYLKTTENLLRLSKEWILKFLKIYYLN